MVSAGGRKQPSVLDKVGMANYCGITPEVAAAGPELKFGQNQADQSQT